MLGFIYGENMSLFQTDLPLHLFHHGENFKTYELMGAHSAICNKKRGFVFRVWAPRAQSVSVVGEFNEWNPDSHVMERMIDGETIVHSRAQTIRFLQILYQDAGRQNAVQSRSLRFPYGNARYGYF